MSLQKNTYFYVVDSSDRLSGDDSNFSVEIPGAEDYKYVSLHGFTCSKSWYSLDTPYDTFTVNGVALVVTSQNYSLTTLAVELKTRLDALGVGVWTVTANRNTGRYTFSTTFGGAVTFVFPADRVFSRTLGMDLVETFVGTITSRYVVDLQRTTALYITTNMVTGLAQNSILHCVHGANYVGMTNISYYNPACSETRLQKNNQGTAEFSILDDNLNSINLHGNQVIISLVFYRDDYEALADADYSDVGKIWGSGV